MQDGLAYRIRVSQYNIGPKTHHVPAETAQFCVPALIIFPAVGGVLISVDFDDQHRLNTSEISNKRTSGMLTAKFPSAQLPATQSRP